MTAEIRHEIVKDLGGNLGEAWMVEATREMFAEIEAYLAKWALFEAHEGEASRDR